MTQTKGSKIIIEGRTEEGKTFRPSDWAERMSGRGATFKNHRIYYSPLLHPGISDDGYKCIHLDPELKKSNAVLFDTIIEFAIKNKLKICGQDDK